MVSERNPNIVIQAESRKRCCPKCKFDDFNGRNVQGTVTFTCKNPECKNQWQGGLGMPEDPTRPMAPQSSTPPLVEYVRNTNPQIPGDVIEIRHRPDPTPAFRKGALIPEDEE